MRLKRDCISSALPRSSALHTVNARGSVISLAGRFLRLHIALRKHDMFTKSLDGKNLHLFFERIPHV